MNNAANIAAMSATLSAANSARQANEARERRLRNKGNDEVYFEVDESIDSVGNRIARLIGYDYEDGQIIERHKKFSVGAFLTSLIVGVFIGFIILLFWDLFTDDYNSPMFIPIRIIILAIIDVVVSVIIGFGCGGDRAIGIIELSEVSRSKTGVQIQVYDSDGYRNFHEKDINTILKEFEEEVEE